MLEITTTRNNPLVDPQLHVWGWEIPLYLFVGGIVAGMMVIAGVAMLRAARGDDTRTFFSLQTPLLAFVLLNLGMLALLLDLAHPLYVWAVYFTFAPASPMSWGSWVLLLVYAVLLVSALVRLHEAWPWLAEKLPQLRSASDWLLATRTRLAALGWINIAFGVAVGIYTGILLNTMVARPLWNTSILPALFLVSGLSAGAALMHVAAVLRPARAVPDQLSGAFAAIVQPIGPELPEPRTVDSLVRVDILLLALELVLVALLLLGLATSTAAQAEAASLLLSGRYAIAFWAVIVIAGIAVPIVLQALELKHRIRHTLMPALLVLAGGFALRWVLVNAGQASDLVRAAGTY